MINSSRALKVFFKFLLWIGVSLGLLAAYAVGLVFVSLSGDGFADNLEIPSYIEISEPTPWPDGDPDTLDVLGREIRQAAFIAADQKDQGEIDHSSLHILRRDYRDQLRAYLAMHPGWRLQLDSDGKTIARRRLAIGGMWRSTLHNYYGSSDFKGANYDEQGYFANVRLELGEDYIGILPTSGNIHEAISQFLGNEMSQLAESIINIRPYGSSIYSRIGASSFDLSDHDSQGGVYDSQLWINPGEPGMVFYKAFEITKDTPLSIPRLKRRTAEWVGWSDNPSEQFYSNAQFTIYEGDWDQFYAARFEIWFKPDSGAPVRKLLEKNFKVQGWMR